MTTLHLQHSLFCCILCDRITQCSLVDLVSTSQNMVKSHCKKLPVILYCTRVLTDDKYAILSYKRSHVETTLKILLKRNFKLILWHFTL